MSELIRRTIQEDVPLKSWPCSLQRDNPHINGNYYTICRQEKIDYILIKSGSIVLYLFVLYNLF